MTKAANYSAAVMMTLLTACLVYAGVAAARTAPETHGTEVRWATYNTSLSDPFRQEGELLEELETGEYEKAENLARTIQETRPDVLLLNEVDYDQSGSRTGPAAAEAFRDLYLQESQEGSEPITYPYIYAAPVNTGVPSGFDLDGDGKDGGPADALGFGFYPGQYGMVVLSKYPILQDEVRTFQNFLLKDIPDVELPDDPDTSEPADFYTDEELEVLPLSSKSHWDVPIRVGKKTAHFLVAHPTPPVFDGPSDYNGIRNFYEIRFWADYVGPGRKEGSYSYDDSGEMGGLAPGEKFVIAGDYNADPDEGDSRPGAISQLLEEPLVQSRQCVPTSDGALEAARDDGDTDVLEGNDAADTADFGTPPGNLRVDYVLPRKGLPITGCGVLWPAAGEDLSGAVEASDHRLVWVDTRVSGRARW